MCCVLHYMICRPLCMHMCMRSLGLCRASITACARITGTHDVIHRCVRVTTHAAWFITNAAHASRPWRRPVHNPVAKGGSRCSGRMLCTCGNRMSRTGTYMVRRIGGCMGFV